jgi:aminopeptidase
VDRADLTRRLADLAVSFAANVQPGQIVTVSADHGQYEVARAIAEAAYKRGAKFVDIQYFDPYLKRARIAFAADDTLEFVPSWFSYRMLAIGEERAARISLAGPTTTGLLDDLDPERAGRDQLPFTKEILKVIGDRTTNWTVVPCPTEPWARLVFPDLSPDDALDKLWEQVAHVCRLDEPDPVAMWRPRAFTLRATRPWTGSSISRTSRPKRSTRPPTRSERTGTFARRSRSCSRTERSSAGFRSGSRGARRSRSTPSRVPA